VWGLPVFHMHSDETFATFLEATDKSTGGAIRRAIEAAAAEAPIPAERSAQIPPASPQQQRASGMIHSLAIAAAPPRPASPVGPSCLPMLVPGLNLATAASPPASIHEDDSEDPPDVPVAITIASDGTPRRSRVGSGARSRPLPGAET